MLLETLRIPKSVVAELEALRETQKRHALELGDSFQDHNLVISFPDGRPVEERFIAKALKDLIKANNLPEVVFHSLRHLSTSLKLKVSNGDIKAVQGDTGHAQAAMVTEVYGHTFDDNRKQIAMMMDTAFFHPEQADQEDEKISRVIAALKKNPALADLILASAGI